jgi:hypothetical protein
MSSCTNLDVLPVSSQASSSPVVVIIISVAVVILLLVITIIIIFIRRVSATSTYSVPKSDEPKHYTASTTEYSAYLHYCMADDQYVRQHIAPRLDGGGQKTRLCLHHRDLMTKTTVGEAISKAVSQSQCLIILASPAYSESSIPRYELQMILACMPVGVRYPVIVIVRGGDVAGSRAQFRDQVGTPCDGWTFCDIYDVLVWDMVVKLLPSDMPSYSSRSTAIGITDNPIERVIQPDILQHHHISATEDTYASVDDYLSDQEPFIADNFISSQESRI